MLTYMDTIFDDLHSYGYKAIGALDLPGGTVSITTYKETQELNIIEILDLFKAYELEVTSCKIFISENGVLRANIMARKNS